MQASQDRFLVPPGGVRVPAKAVDALTSGEDSLTAIPIVRSARHTQSLASSAGADVAREFGDGAHQDFSSGSGSCSGIGFPNSAATFFWTSMMI